MKEGRDNMKKEYISPEIELLKMQLSSDVLSVSDPDEGVDTGSGTGQSDPSTDPFGDLP